MIESQFTETVQVHRLVDVPGTNKKAFAIHIASLRCAIQPLEADTTQDIPGGFGKSFLMFCPVVDLKEGDRIIRDVDESGDGREYRVVASESFDFQGQSHMEVIIRIFE
jgi:hypothetical protein